MKSNRGLYQKLVVALPFFGLAIMACTNAKLFPLPAEYPIVTLQVQNYCPHTVGTPATGFYAFKDIFFYNAQSYFNNTNYVLDTDGDGLPDFYEQNPTNMALWDISYLYADTPQLGYSDPVRVRLGILASAVPSLPTCNTGYTDSDQDGLTDCEEQLLGTLTSSPDTDGDGILDGIETRFGMDPLDPNDAYIEANGDGFTNYQKVKWGIPISTYVTPSAQAFFPNYQVAPTSNPTGSCATPQTFTISNISILPVVGGNALWVRTLETPLTPGLTTFANYITVIVPSNVVSGSTVVVSSWGTGGQTITNPNIIAPGK
jgi:hypothetical protein